MAKNIEIAVYNTGVDVFKGVEQNRSVVIILIKIIFIYSAINRAAKGPPLYSVLNPDTSSDSPSAKSKGVRLVSASAVVNQTIKMKGMASINKEGYMYILLRFNVNITIIGDNIIRVILTSYEIVWAAPRKAPRSAYLELEDQPATKVVYTFILEIARNIKMPNDTW